MKNINLLVFILFFVVFIFSPCKTFAASIFEDNFDDPNISAQKWTQSGPQLLNGDGTQANWKFENGVVGMKIVNKGFQFNELIPKNWNSAIKNYQMEFDMKLLSGADTNFVFRYKDHFNWYGVHGNSTQFFLQKAGGNWSQLPSMKNISFALNQFYHFKVIVKEDNMKIYVDDSLMWDVTDTGTHLSSGLPGLQASTGAITSSEVVFDNFKVTSLDNGTVLSVPYFSQNDNPWGPTEYDHSSRLLNTPTIDRWGCAMTSAAMVLRYHGITNFGSEYENKNIDPQTLNEWLKNKGGYLYGVGSKGPYAILDWNKISELSGILEDIGKAPYALEHTRSDGAQQDNLIKDFILNKKNPVILGVTNSQTDGHFIVATGIEDTTWDINDPEWNYPTLASFNNSYYQADYYSPSHTDLSYIVGVINPDVHMLFVDPNGKKTGKIFEKNQWVDYNEIPNAVYDFERPISNPDSNGRKEELGTGVNEFLLPKPLEGNYKIIISSSDPNSLYTLNTDLFQKDATDSAQKITGYVGGINQDIFIINFTPNSASQVVKQVTYTSALTDLEELWNAKQISKKSVYVVLKEELEVAQKASKKKNGNAAEKVTLLLAKRTVEESKKQFTIEGYQIMKYDIEYLIKNL